MDVERSGSVGLARDHFFEEPIRPANHSATNADRLEMPPDDVFGFRWFNLRIKRRRPAR